MTKVKIMKMVAILAAISNLFGCSTLDVLDGPGMVNVDSEHRTEYANTLPFDEYDGCPYWAVAYLGKGDDGKNAADEYIEKLFTELSEEKRKAVNHYDYGGEKWYLIIPRYPDKNYIIRGNDEEKAVSVKHGDAFTINCGDDVKIRSDTLVRNELVLQTDENDRLICTKTVRDITEYKK